MIRKLQLITAIAALGLSGLTGPAAAQSIQIEDPYFRTSGPMARAGAAFMTLVNPGTEDDRLIAARADIAARVELHTHIATGDGVMRMREVEDGFPIPAGGRHVLARGGDHVMFMGLSARPADGASVRVTLVFETAGEVVLDIPVDQDRPAEAGHAHDHAHDHGAMSH